MLLIDIKVLGNQVRGPRLAIFKKGIWCFWCKEKGHKKSNCGKFKVWPEKQVEIRK